MTDSQASVITTDGTNVPEVSTLDLSGLSPVYVLATHLSINEQHEAENALNERGAPLTYDIHEAKLVLGNISRTQRAKLELKWKGVHAEEVEKANPDKPKTTPPLSHSKPARKRRKIDMTGPEVGGAREAAEVLETTPKTTSQEETDVKPMSQLSISELPSSPSSIASGEEQDEALPSAPTLPDIQGDSVMVVRLEWLNEVVRTNHLIPVEPYAILHARTSSVEEPQNHLRKHASPVRMHESKHVRPEAPHHETRHHDQNSILERAKADSKPKPVHSRHSRRDRVADAAKSDVLGKSFSSTPMTRPIQLLHQTTSEDNEVKDSPLPSMPDWVLQNKIYSCERSTPLNPPNSEFVELLKRIRLARELTLDQIGVRAYSTSIASLAAYPYPLHKSREVLALPGCDAKIVHLFHEYHTTGQLQAVVDIDADPALTCLRSFYEIWGVGAVTAREFYYDKGWRDLDDVIEFGWKSLSRVQQIGLKYYDDFHEPLSRAKVEAIAATITHHAALLTDTNIQAAIVGGYRRGNRESADVDIILSHPDESQTLNLVTKILTALETAGCITHTLTLNLKTSHRDQNPVPINTGTQHGYGLDSLDKALVVWQDPLTTTTTTTTTPTNPTEPIPTSPPKPKNPNPHHRVDIIISPWRTVGCAVAGWTSGTTFQRDLRRYCKYKQGWKFDSSGVRERATGAWVDLEGYRDERTRCRGWEEAERRVFRGLGLVWREPWERCTG